MAVRCLGFAMLMLAAGILVLGVSAQYECKGDLGEILNACGKFVGKGGPKIPPSQECCGVIKDADVPCFCKYGGFVETCISMEKAVYVATYCGLKVPPGTKCGSYTVPPSPPPPSPLKA